MEERQDALVMTVHLLANAGHSLLLQQTLDHLLEWIFPDIRLFLVSERVAPVTCYERHHPKRLGFPGTSVLLFLHEGLGTERVFRVLDSFRHPPWKHHQTRSTPGRSPAPAGQEFYGLDDRMPVWGVRRVRYGAEILRVTLYCSFDNYEDAVRLYETILRKAVTVQKGNLCFFVLHSTRSFTVQLSLKQLPLGMAVELKESTILQFKVQEIGQLVPLLPNPCVPISGTRWQTQDYDGNTILFQVQANPGVAERNDRLCPRDRSSAGAGTVPHTSPRPLNFPQRIAEPRPERGRAARGKPGSLTPPESRGSLTSESPCSSPRSSSCSSPYSSSPAAGAQRDRSSLHLGSARLKTLSQGSEFPEPEEEVDVDTGFPVVGPGRRQTSLSTFPRDVRDSLPLRGLPLSFADQGDGRVGKAALEFHLQRSEAPRGNEEEEEFFL
ncbi:protein FAM124B [Ornithorhynchus anatinus]|uniref:Family with sequence similarity 124 member B n=1 Tax=Ornithorhynchus anatinus TaxID=9258 RepID=A0A6I8NZP2_ORNAN|nr:protein FAM124B [Ornithorhynchus anatinus]